MHYDPAMAMRLQESGHSSSGNDASRGEISLDSKGKYLGAWIGLGAGGLSWNAALEKYVARCDYLRADAYAPTPFKRTI